MKNLINELSWKAIEFDGDLGCYFPSNYDYSEYLKSDLPYMEAIMYCRELSVSSSLILEDVDDNDTVFISYGETHMSLPYQEILDMVRTYIVTVRAIRWSDSRFYIEPDEILLYYLHGTLHIETDMGVHVIETSEHITSIVEEYSTNLSKIEECYTLLQSKSPFESVRGLYIHRDLVSIGLDSFIMSGMKYNLIPDESCSVYFNYKTSREGDVIMDMPSLTRDPGELNTKEPIGFFTLPDELKGVEDIANTPVRTSGNEVFDNYFQFVTEFDLVPFEDVEAKLKELDIKIYPATD